MQNAAAVGKHLKEKLVELRGVFPVVSDVRGLGLMIGVEFAKKDSVRTPARDLRDQIIQKAFQKGLLLLGCGQSTIRLCPPLIVNESEVDVAVKIFASSLKELTQ